MEVRGLLGRTVATCAPGTALHRAAESMVTESVGSLAVMDGRNLVGLITERDILRAVAEAADLSSQKVRDWMTHNPDTVEPDLSVDEAADWMLATGYRHLPVTDGTQLLGMVSIKDVLWAVTEPSSHRT